MNLKKVAGERAVEFIKDGMTVGLGTGSTVHWTLMRLGSMVKKGFNVRAVPTSKPTEELALELGIRLVTLAEVQELDLTIDGADEISPSLDLIKGAGGALLREKLIAAASIRLVIVAEEKKLVPALGSAPLPVEVVRFAWEATARRVGELNCVPTLRLETGEPYVTDNGNYILDCACGMIDDPAGLNRALKLLPGVVETGLFIGMADVAVVAAEDGVKIINSASSQE